jgi:putative acetyltransferase
VIECAAPTAGASRIALAIPSAPDAATLGLFAMTTVRTTRLSDRDAILAVVRAAFSGGGRDPQEELDVVTNTWALNAAPDDLDLVATEDDTVVGYVVAARGRLNAAEALGVAPLAVAPDRQHAGIGTALMTELLGRADGDGWPLLLLLGDPAYYSRFGFEPASQLGITYAGLGGPDPHFQGRKLARYDSALGGTFTYSWERST